MNTPMAWSVILPVKAIEVGKSRLHADRSTRIRLGSAFLSDVLAALHSAHLVDEVIVVGDDPAVQALAVTAGARAIAEAAEGGLNPAASVGLRAARPDAAVAVMVADLPCLTGPDVDLVLAQASRYPASFVCDTTGTGTTMLMAERAGLCRPQFGERSRARHAHTGYVELSERIDLELGLPERAAAFTRARRDVDTEVDLCDAIRIGVGPATAAALRGTRGTADAGVASRSD